MPQTAPLHCFQPEVSIDGRENLTLLGNCHIGSGTVIQAAGGLTIGNNVVFSFDCVIWSINHDYEGNLLPYSFARVKRPISIGDYVWAGRNVIIAPGSQIGEGAVIGIGAVVSGTIPPLAVVAGNPAKVVRYRSPSRYLALREGGQTLWKDHTSCPACTSPHFYLTDSGERNEWHPLWRWLPRPMRLWLQQCIIRRMLKKAG